MGIVARSFSVLSFSEAIALLRESRVPARAVAITFDDGYADNARVAAPILKRLGLPATFFIATGYLNGGRMWNDTVIESIRRWPSQMMDLAELGLGCHRVDTTMGKVAAIDAIIKQVKHRDPAKRVELVSEIERRAQACLPNNLMMTTEQLRELFAQGMEIGAHTVTHPILARIPDDCARSEIEGSKVELESILGAPVRFFAYPNGKPGIDYDDRHVAMVQRAGFLAATSTAIGAQTGIANLLQIPRFTPWRKSSLAFGIQLASNYLRTRYDIA